MDFPLENYRLCTGIVGDPTCCQSCDHFRHCRQQHCEGYGLVQDPTVWRCQMSSSHYTSTGSYIEFLFVAHQEACVEPSNDNRDILWVPVAVVSSFFLVLSCGVLLYRWRARQRRRTCPAPDDLKSPSASPAPNSKRIDGSQSPEASSEAPAASSGSKRASAFLFPIYLRAKSISDSCKRVKVLLSPSASEAPAPNSKRIDAPESPRTDASESPMRAEEPGLIRVGRNKLPTSVPHYWADLPALEQGWTLYPVFGDDLRALRRMFVVQRPLELGKGRDAMRYHRKYSNLLVHCAWRFEHESLWPKYVAERNDVMRHMCQIRKNRLGSDSWQSRLEESSSSLPGERFDEVGERYLLHGTGPDHLLDILHQGFTEKLASLKGLFGAGNYLAEDPEKIDQYTRPDPGLETPGLEEIHSRLYRAGGNYHPGEDMFYCFVVRATCGASLQISGLDQDRLRDETTGRDVFLTPDRRELARIPGTSPAFSYHSLVVNLGAGKTSSKAAVARFREFVIFEGNRIYPEYLVAYRRV